MEANDAQFIKGFNGGYLLEQYEPDMLATVLKNLDLSDDFLQGLSDGQKEYQQERIRTELKKLSHLRDQGKEQDRGTERE